MSDDAFGDLLSGFSTPARQQNAAAKPEMDKDILDLFGPTPPVASASRASAGNGGHPPPAQQVQSMPCFPIVTQYPMKPDESSPLIGEGLARHKKQPSPISRNLNCFNQLLKGSQGTDDPLKGTM